MAIDYKIYSHGAKNYIIIFASVSRPEPTVRRLVAAAGRSDVWWWLADGRRRIMALSGILWYTGCCSTFKVINYETTILRCSRY
jgi:hypothetical protein